VYFASAPGPVPDIAALTDEHGTFSLSAPMPGLYTLECAVEGFATARVQVHAASGRETTVDIRLTRA
jgi:Carboxypeptidase regulatory-like domain